MSVGAIPPITPSVSPVNTANSAIGGIGSLGGPAPAEGASSGGRGFGDMVLSKLEETSATEFKADDLVQRLAAGEDVRPHEIMIANSKAELAVELVVAVRNKALEAYREVMNLQI